MMASRLLAFQQPPRENTLGIFAQNHQILGLFDKYSFLETCLYNPHRLASLNIWKDSRLILTLWLIIARTRSDPYVVLEYSNNKSIIIS